MSVKHAHNAVVVRIRGAFAPHESASRNTRHTSRGSDDTGTHIAVKSNVMRQTTGFEHIFTHAH